MFAYYSTDALEQSTRARYVYYDTLKLEYLQNCSFLVVLAMRLVALLAQLVEQRFYTAKVGGSNPSGRTKTKTSRFFREVFVLWMLWF